ncbi:pre-mRNA-processing factor 17-like protein [Camelus ferus]|nr:pre-mRNA-processing factor 17-like protein [Camelus ferus]
MSAAIAALAASYGSGSGSESDSDSEGGRCSLPAADSLMHLTKSPSAKPSLAVAVDSAPEVAVKEDLETGVHLDPAVKEVQYNPTYETMFAPEFGPENPFRTQQMAAPRNMLSGYAEPAHINDFMFEQQRRTFATYGLTVFETGQKKIEKRKKFKENDASNIDGFLGPWAKYVDEKDVAKPSELKKCMTTKAGPIFTYLRMLVLICGQLCHLRSVTFPKNKYMCGLDTQSCREVKIEQGIQIEDKPESDCGGHSKAVRDICFNTAGTQFLSAAYDRYLKLWDTETGQCISRFTNRKVPYCVKFNPDEDKQNLFVAGMSDKKIVQWDIRSGEIVQEYDRHLGAVNTIVFVDENRRFVSTSDDKSLRVWEWEMAGMPVDGQPNLNFWSTEQI